MEKNKPFNFREPELMDKLRIASDLAWTYNNTKLSRDEQIKYLNNWLGAIGNHSLIKPPFNCDFGFNIEVGNNTVININSVMFDREKISFGDNVMVGPNCAFYTSIHPMDSKTRNEGMMLAEPITIENDVWLSGNVTVLPGVTIGSGAVIGAGSVVTKDVEANCFYAGNPAQKIKEINQLEVDEKFR